MKLIRSGNLNKMRVNKIKEAAQLDNHQLKFVELSYEKPKESSKKN